MHTVSKPVLVELNTLYQTSPSAAHAGCGPFPSIALVSFSRAALPGSRGPSLGIHEQVFPFCDEAVPYLVCEGHPPFCNMRQKLPARSLDRFSRRMLRGASEHRLDTPSTEHQPDCTGPTRQLCEGEGSAQKRERAREKASAQHLGQASSLLWLPSLGSCCDIRVTGPQVLPLPSRLKAIFKARLEMSQKRAANHILQCHDRPGIYHLRGSPSTKHRQLANQLDSFQL